MKNNIITIILLALACNSLVAAPNSYWQCMSHDKANKQWFVKNNYKKAAVNLSLASCKKESEYPYSCKVSLLDCEGFRQGRSTNPAWQCTALDRIAQHWENELNPQRLDAALAAKAFCSDQSTIPNTCYVNMITCRNLNENFGI